MRTILILLLVGSWVGCSDTPSRISSVDWEPDQIADQAIADFDKDADGQLSMDELKSAPGLKALAKQYGQLNGKKMSSQFLLTRENIYDRLSRYQEMRGSISPLSCKVTLNGKPLAGAAVKLVPESFQGTIIPPADGTSDASGNVRPVTEGSDLPGVRLGMYRVEITSPEVSIPAKYNTQTILGVEVSGMTNPAGPPVFALRRSK